MDVRDVRARAIERAFDGLRAMDHGREDDDGRTTTETDENARRRREKTREKSAKTPSSRTNEDIERARAFRRAFASTNDGDGDGDEVGDENDERARAFRRALMKRMEGDEGEESPSASARASAGAALVARMSARVFVREFAELSAMYGKLVSVDLDGMRQGNDLGDGRMRGRGAARARERGLATALTRARALSDASGVRRDAATCVETVIPSALRAMSRGNVRAYELARVAATTHPNALRANACGLEAACAKALRESSRASERQAAIRLLATLPRVAGDAQAWSEYARRLMRVASDGMNRAFEGAEDGAARRALDAALEPAGEAAPAGFGVGGLGATAIECAITGMRCLEEMLRTRFSTAVPMPNAAVVELVARALDVDGGAAVAVPGTLPTPVDPELVFELPRVHEAALALLEALLVSAQTTAIPQAGRIARALEGVLRRSAPTAAHLDRSKPARSCMRARARAHDTIASACYALGGACASGELASAVAAYVIQDAKPRGARKSAVDGATKENTSSGKKRKKKGGAWGAATAEGLNDLNTAALLDDMNGPAAGTTAMEAMKLQTSALHALAAFCNVGGAMLAPSVRTKLDSAVAHATAQVIERPLWDDFDDIMVRRRDAVYDALLASVLAPRPFRSPNLPLAIAVFSKGAQDPATSKKCTQAAMAINALLHPSAPPLAPQALAPPREEHDDRTNDVAPQWSMFASYHEAPRDKIAPNASRASAIDAEPANAPKVARTTVRAASPTANASPIEDEDADHEMDIDATTSAMPEIRESVPFLGASAASGGFGAIAKSTPAFASTTKAPPYDFISLSAAPTKNARTRAEMWEITSEPIDLGNGKPKVVMALSDDSDGELPEIHSGTTDEDDDDEVAEENDGDASDEDDGEEENEDEENEEEE